MRRPGHNPSTGTSGSSSTGTAHAGGGSKGNGYKPPPLLCVIDPGSPACSQIPAQLNENNQPGQRNSGILKGACLFLEFGLTLCPSTATGDTPEEPGTTSAASAENDGIDKLVAAAARAAAQEAEDALQARGGVYTLRDVAGEVVRTGRSSNLAARELQLANDPVLGQYEFQVEYRTDVYAEQRGLEQMLYDSYPEAQAANGGYNMIRAISPLNPNLPIYAQSASDYLAWLANGGG